MILKLGIISTVGLVGALLAGSQSAHAASTVYNSFGIGSSGNCNCFSPQAKGPDVPGTFLPAGENWLADSFTPSISGQLDQIKLSIGNGGGVDGNEGTSGGYPGVVVILIGDNGSGNPNDLGEAALETWVKTNVPASANNQKPTSFSSKTHPMLTAGTKYWIILKPIGVDSNIIWWTTSKSGVASSILSAEANGGTSWTGYGSPQSAFSVSVE